MDERLERFRGYFARLEPSADPAFALKEKLYVEPPGRSLADQVAARLHLAPSSSHAAVGGIGSGKSTELLRILRKLKALEDTRVVYVDVSQRHDLDRDLEGVLLVLAGLEACRIVGASKGLEVVEARRQFARWAHDHRHFVHEDDEHEYDDRDYDDDPPGHWESTPGIITPPVPALTSLTKERIEALTVLKQALPKGVKHLILLFDSLDRLTDLEAFRAVAQNDVRALKAVGIGVVVVAPSRILYGVNRGIVDLFDQIHEQPPLDVAQDPAAADFLAEVLLRRTEETLLPGPIRAALVQRSGGVLRDLIALAQSAVEEAFLDGVDAVSEEHVARATDRFGRSLMRGLGKDELSTLQSLRRKRKFVVTDDLSQALLESRRVLEYGGPPKRHALHPTLVELLAGLES